MYSLYKNIIHILTPRERRAARAFVAANTLISLLDIGCIVFLLLVLQVYTGGKIAAQSNVLLQWLLAPGNTLLPAIWLLLLFSVKNMLGHGVYQYQVKFITRTANRLSRANLSAYLEGDYNNFSQQDSAVFVSKIIHQPTEFAQYVLLNFQLLLTECLMVAFSLAALLWYNARLLLVVVMALLPPVCVLLLLTRRRLGYIKQNIKTLAARSLQYLREALAGFVESNIFDKNHFFIHRHAVTQEELGKKITGMQITQDLPARFFEVFAILGLFLLIVAIKLSGGRDGTYIVMLGAFMAAAYKIIPGISKIMNLHSQVRAYQHTITGVMPAPTLWRKPVAVKNNPLTSIALREVSFAYHGSKLLDRFHCTIPAGTLCGIGGASGKGKTTLMNLVAGLLEPDEGAIVWNGVPLARADRSRWQDIAYAKQESFMLHASVLDNIVLFEAPYNTAKLQAVLAATGLDVFLSQFPEGVHKMVMESGRNLSGGQRQRIALARALYKDAPVLLLDEPFSELDKAAELAMLQHLKTLAARGRIVLLISHNEESLAICDTVIRLNAAPLPGIIA
ncbi:MAG TPA: ATP-binding cassette domain-containing protein [Chitinophaga sp.]